MGINYFDVKSYTEIDWELSKLDLDVESIINIETKKSFFRIWYKKLQD